MPRGIGNIDMGLARVAISNLNYIRRFQKQAISKLLEPVNAPRLRNPGVPPIKLGNKGRIISIISPVKNPGVPLMKLGKGRIISIRV